MERNLTHLSWMEIRDLDKHQGAVVLPIGAIEQHGPHLPVITDTLLVERVLQAALDQLPAHILLWHLPTLPYAKSNEHSGFPGTFSLSAATLSQVVREVAQGIKQAGFRRLVLLNAHGGNRTVLDTLARDIRLEFVALGSPGVSPEEDRVIHEAMKMGADVVGACPAITPEPEHCLEAALNLANALGKPVDFHLDEHSDPSQMLLRKLAELTLERGLSGRVVAGHCCRGWFDPCYRRRVARLSQAGD